MICSTIAAGGASRIQPCAKKAAATGGYRCDPKDRDDCKAQCKAGNAESCYNAALSLIVSIVAVLWGHHDARRHPRLAAAVLGFAIVAGVFGAWTNASAIL